MRAEAWRDPIIEPNSASFTRWRNDATNQHLSGWRLCQDHYHQLAVCSNRAHHLSKASAKEIESCWPDALDWYCLPHAIEYRFSLANDTAIDAVFLAELWLGSPENARQIESQAFFWIDGRHPGQQA